MTIMQFIVDYLSDKLDVPVRIKYPEDEDAFILVEKVGVSMRNYIQSATVSLKAYAPNLYEAESLIGRTRKAIEGMVEKNEISAVHLDTDAPWPDPSRKEDRYQAVYIITHYLDD